LENTGGNWDKERRTWRKTSLDPGDRANPQEIEEFITGLKKRSCSDFGFSVGLI